MAEADMNRPPLTRLARRRQLIQEQEEAAKKQEEALQGKDKATKRNGVRRKKEEELSKQQQVLKKPKKHRKRIRASAAGSSSPPRQPPPPGPATHIHQLPEEMLAKIFEPLNPKTMFKVLTVCQRWKDVIEDRNVIKKLVLEGRHVDPFLNIQVVLEGRNVTTQEALCLIKSAPKLKSLELDRHSDAVALLDAASVHCTNLLKLSVDFTNSYSVSLGHTLMKVFQSSPHITELRLRRLDLAAEGLQFCQELGALLPDLRKLEFNIELSDLELHAVIDGCSRHQMKEFKARHNPCSDAQVAKLVQCWGSSLRALELDASNLTDGALARLAGCSELRRLQLDWLSTPSDWLRGLAALAHLEELYVFVSDLAEIEQENLCRFFSHSRSSHQLRTLSLLGGSGVDDSVLASVAAFCPQLEDLEVIGLYVTISGVREVLRCCRKMHTLDLCGMDASVANFVSELPQLAPQLRRFRIGDVDKCSLDEATLRRVQAQMPRLRIEFY